MIFGIIAILMLLLIMFVPKASEPKFYKNIFLFLTIPFWYPWLWIKDKLYDPDEGKWKILRIVLQLVATLITSYVYIVFWLCIFCADLPQRGDDYYDRQQYYERKYEPGW